MTMRAVVHTKFGPPEVLHLSEIPRPEPGPGDVLVRVHSTTVNRTDCGLRSATPWIARFFTGWLRPKHPVLGTEFAGVVESVGANVKAFAPGDRVFGVNANDMGAHAEYLCLREGAPISKMPDHLSFDEAAAVCDGMVLGLMLLRSAEVGAGSRIVVYGASGSIGTAAVQLAKVLGAHVTAVVDTKHVDLARDLGADEVIDRLTTDFTRLGRRWDTILDSVGKLTFSRCRGSLAARGTYVSTDLGPLWQNPVLALVSPRAGGRHMHFPIPHYRKSDVEWFRDLLAKGEYRAVIDRRYSLEDILEATRYVETAQKTGNVVIRVIGADEAPAPT
jgi:NADPH:quinone reductase-like Zn-dependent oxidoreductase